ncbi:unnamed protein product [Caenorhabditis auriculariae]|uniref:Uncharacterized protein n=1 Tax=Caenorhabditis auriculariae TaxID=2777116 RepID=A0A8S1HII9_9PELO|nr:unnamed protein product [Caenorhabditis auriculariae]
MTSRLASTVPREDLVAQKAEEMVARRGLPKTQGRYQTWKKPIYVSPHQHPLEQSPDFSFKDGRPIHFTSQAQLDHKVDQLRLARRIVSLLNETKDVESAHRTANSLREKAKADKRKMGRFKSQKRNKKETGVAISKAKLKKIRKASKKGEPSIEEDVVMEGEQPLVLRARGLSVASTLKLASGEEKNVPRVNPKKTLRRDELPVFENGVYVDKPSGKVVSTRNMSVKKARKVVKKMKHHARDVFANLKEELAAEKPDAMES